VIQGIDHAEEYVQFESFKPHRPLIHVEQNFVKLGGRSGRELPQNYVIGWINPENPMTMSTALSFVVRVFHLQLVSTVQI
jgi:hypothetical protein